MFSSQFRDDKRNNVQFAVPGRQYFLLSQFFLCFCHPYFLFCHFETSSLFNLSSRKAERSEVYPGSRNQSQYLYSWVPDTARYTRSSGTTKGIMFSSQFRDDRRNNVQFAVSGRQCFNMSSLLFICHLETSSLFNMSSRKAERSEVYPGSRS